MPFVGPEAANPSRWRRITTVDLRQVAENPRGRTEFAVLGEFGYTTLPASGVDGAGEYWLAASVEHLVPRGMTTDLATVPAFLWGVVASYGRQTLPAILHDELCYAAARPGQPAPYRRRARREADAIFREALAVAGTGPVRRWLMWTGVRIGGRREVAAALAATLASVAAAVLSPWRAARAGAAVASAASAAALVAAAAGAGVECGRADPAGGGAGAVAPAEEYTPARLAPRAVGDLVGAAVIGAVAAPVLLPVAAVTVVTKALVGFGERRAAIAPASGEGAQPTGATARITWAPLVGPGDSTVSGNPGREDL
jgi:hypothetical protein